ncbi:hypothetical protein XENOCAPTIV_004497, partial [Xenoophorus captivus]
KPLISPLFITLLFQFDNLHTLSLTSIDKDMFCCICTSFLQIEKHSPCLPSFTVSLSTSHSLRLDVCIFLHALSLFALYPA